MNNKIDIVAVGPQKTATTWLYEQLKYTEELSFPVGVKETFFWDDKFDYVGQSWYFDHFKKDGKLMEVAPSYFHSLKAIERIYINNPNSKIIITLRNPMLRAYSLYLHHMRMGRYTKTTTFFEASTKIDEIIEAGHYKKYITEWINKFGKENVVILLQEDIQTTSKDVILKLSEFIGVKNIKLDESKLTRKVNSASMPASILLASLATKIGYKLRSFKLYWIIEIFKNLGIKKLIYSSSKDSIPKIDYGTFSELYKIYKSDIEFVEELLKKDLNTWKKLKY